VVRVTIKKHIRFDSKMADLLVVFEQAEEWAFPNLWEANIVMWAFVATSGAARESSQLTPMRSRI
jgi:hypothetical protein